MQQKSPLINKIPFTKEAYTKLQLEKKKLEALRVEVLARLKEAREQGDLSENGAYKYAKFELGNIGRQLRQINYQLHNGYIAAVSSSASNTAQFGSTITLQNTTDQKEMTFTLVSEFESNPAEKKLSTTSPIGTATLGKKLHDIIQVQTPTGAKTFTIIKLVS
jgi:transcription elongation factor GreA